MLHALTLAPYEYAFIPFIVLTEAAFDLDMTLRFS